MENTTEVTSILQRIQRKMSQGYRAQFSRGDRDFEQLAMVALRLANEVESLCEKALLLLDEGE